MTPRTADKIVVAILFIAGWLTLNVLESSLTNHVLGVAFFIASIYGFVLTARGNSFMFRK